MIKAILRALVKASSGAATSKDRPSARPVMRTRYHWRCECGAHSRGGDLIRPGAEYNAQRHQFSKGVGHPMPEVYTTEEERPY